MTGTPGTGKTTIAEILSEKLDTLHIELSTYAKENGYITENDPERDTQVVDMDALSRALKHIIERTSHPIVVDGHYSHELIDESLVTLVVILRRAPWKLQETLQNRAYHYEKVLENLDAEIMGVIAGEAEEEYPREKLHEIDTTNISAEEAASEIINVVKGKKPVSFGPIDWITYPETLRVLVNRTCTLS